MMQKYLEGLKKRAQLILLMLNLLLVTGNTYIMSTKLDKLGQGMILYCRVIDFTDSVCMEQ